MVQQADIQHLAPTEGTAVSIGKFGFNFKVGIDNACAFSIAEVTVPKGATNRVHHHGSEEAMYVLSGEFEFLSDRSAPRRVGAGAVMYVPPNAPHGFVNVGDDDGRLLSIMPCAQEAFLRDLAKRGTP